MEEQRLTLLALLGEAPMALPARITSSISEVFHCKCIIAQLLTLPKLASGSYKCHSWEQSPVNCGHKLLPRCPSPRRPSLREQEVSARLHDPIFFISFLQSATVWVLSSESPPFLWICLSLDLHHLLSVLPQLSANGLPDSGFSFLRLISTLLPLMTFANQKFHHSLFNELNWILACICSSKPFTYLTTISTTTTLATITIAVASTITTHTHTHSLTWNFKKVR